MELKTYSPFDLENLRILGRSAKNASIPLMLYWTASGLEFDLRGSTLEIEMEADFETFEPWFCVSLNGHDLIRMPASKGRHLLPVFTGLDPEQPHHIRILRESQAMPNDPACLLAIHALRFDGHLAPLPEPACRIEIIGDSLTSGEGALGGPTDTEWRPIWFSAAKGYPQLTANLLDGEVRVISQSGWGVRSGWDNNPKSSIPAYYSKVCGVVPGKNGNDSEYDFDSWKPDVVVCALGANDLGAMRGAVPYTDPATGLSYRQNRRDLQPLEDAMVSFLQQIRHCNPDAVIIWLFWNKAEPVCSLTRKAVQRRNLEGDAACFSEIVPGMPADGARNHPGIRSHNRTAERIAAILKRYLKP